MLSVIYAEENKKNRPNGRFFIESVIRYAFNDSIDYFSMFQEQF